MKSHTSSNDDSVLRQAILNYLEEHPDAMEAVDGIAEWWIARSQIRVEAEALRRVLKELIESGILKERLCINFCMSSRHNRRLVNCRERFLLRPFQYYRMAPLPDQI
jgi:hypothetical protein